MLAKKIASKATARKRPRAERSKPVHFTKDLSGIPGIYSVEYEGDAGTLGGYIGRASKMPNGTIADDAVDFFHEKMPNATVAWLDGVNSAKPGGGTRMVSAFVRWAYRNNAKVVALDVFPTEAHMNHARLVKFYEGLGFEKERADIMVHRPKT